MPDRTDAEINARLAEAQGWWRHGAGNWYADVATEPTADETEVRLMASSTWDPLNDIQHAIEVDAMMFERSYTLSLHRLQDGTWTARYLGPPGYTGPREAPTPARAICEAALAALEEA